MIPLGVFSFFWNFHFWVVRGVKMKNNYICHAPYFRNSKAYYQYFWYTCVRWWYLLVFFHLSFEIYIFGAVRRVKGQKIAQNEKWQFHVSHAICQEQYSIWSWILVHLCKMIISPGIFFSLEVLSFWAIRGKRAKNSPKWKITITSVMCHISGTV